MSCPSPIPSDLEVLKLINVDNESAIAADQVVIDEPEVSTENERNTKSNVTSVPTAPFGGRVEVFYDRWDLGVMFHGMPIEIRVSGTPDNGDLICGINAEYGTHLPVDEFTVTDRTEESFVLKANVDSVGYIGQVTVNFAQTRLPLSERMTVNQLNGFAYPNADRPSLNNPVFFKDTVPEPANAWAGSDVNDNRFGYDDIYNGEVHLGARWAAVNPGWNNPRYPVGKRYREPDEQPRLMTSWRQANGSVGQATGWQTFLLLSAAGKSITELLNEYDIDFTIVSRPSANGVNISNTYRAAWNATSNRVVFTRTTGTTGAAAFQGPVTTADSTAPYVITMSGNNSFFPGLAVQKQVIGGSEVNWYTGFGETTMTAVRKAGSAKTVTFTSRFQST